MLEKSKFLVSFDCQNEKFCEELIITYRTEELTSIGFKTAILDL